MKHKLFSAFPLLPLRLLELLKEAGRDVVLGENGDQFAVRGVFGANGWLLDRCG